jgi:pyruvate/2-oxoglutarate dehydrogenase complex dihydrolipoamide dehydrogenase (E3) component
MVARVQQTLEGFDTVLFAIGRRPNVDIDLEKAGVRLNERGYIQAGWSRDFIVVGRGVGAHLPLHGP